MLDSPHMDSYVQPHDAAGRISLRGRLDGPEGGDVPSHMTCTSSTFDRICWVADRFGARETGPSATSGLVRPLPWVARTRPCQPTNLFPLRVRRSTDRPECFEEREEQHEQAD
jgi:hypothetical protein